MMDEAFGLDARIRKYQGSRPIGFYRWDLECLIDVIDSALADEKNTRTGMLGSTFPFKTFIIG
jgi:hypothetical protein